MNIKVLTERKLLTFIAIPLSLAVLYFITWKVTDAQFKEYPLIESDQAVNSVVDETKVFKGTTLLKDINGRRFSIMAFNRSLKVSILHYNLEVGDSISRKSFSDTLFLFKLKKGEIIPFEVQCLK